jgi:hypothetical protein
MILCEADQAGAWFLLSESMIFSENRIPLFRIMP